MCATSSGIELSVKPMIFHLQIHFGGTRRGSDKVPIHGTGSFDYDIVKGKALPKDEALNTRFISKRWNKLLPKLKHPSVSVIKVRGRFEYHI